LLMSSKRSAFSLLRMMISFGLYTSRISISICEKDLNTWHYFH
jgi:hypothetical protein